MNDRINDLANLAGLHAEWFIDNPEIEKFAKLVINECAQRCEDIAIKHQIEETTYAAGKKAGAVECAVGLKQYFRVE